MHAGKALKLIPPDELLFFFNIFFSLLLSGNKLTLASYTQNLSTLPAVWLIRRLLSKLLTQPDGGWPCLISKYFQLFGLTRTEHIKDKNFFLPMFQGSVYSEEYTFFSLWIVIPEEGSI